MTLADTGPLVAMIDFRDAYHRRIIDASKATNTWPLVTTEACLTESLYLLRRNSGHSGDEALWKLIEDDSLIILTPSTGAPQRAREFMARYCDLPCDYADATLLVAAEDHGVQRIFTLDRHFHAYRLTNGAALECIPLVNS